jgi:excisionase family DNA binding protein
VNAVSHADEPLAHRPRDAAKLLGISERTLWQWTKDGSVPHIKRSRIVLYPHADLKAWLTRAAAAQQDPFADDDF